MRIIRNFAMKVVLIVISLVGVLLIAVGVGLALLHLSREHAEGQIELQINEFNPQINRTTKYLVKSSHTLGNEDFVAVPCGEENFCVLSNVGGREFSCSGTCQCDEPPNRRYATLVGSSLFFIISAFSVAMAINIGSKYFQQQCEKELSGKCEMSSIKSGIDGCEEEYKFIEKKEEGRKDNEVYNCFGHCVKNGEVFRNDLYRDEMVVFKCEEFQTAAEVTVPGGEYYSFNKAKSIFEESFLRDYCRITTTRPARDGNVFQWCESEMLGYIYKNVNIQCTFMRYA